MAIRCYALKTTYEYAENSAVRKLRIKFVVVRTYILHKLSNYVLSLIFTRKINVHCTNCNP